MSKTITIAASKRDLTGSANSRRLRAAGQVPAVVYSRGAENILLSVGMDDVMKVANYTGLVEIEIEGGERKLAEIKEVQMHVISCKPLCIDFHEVPAQA